MRAVSVENLPCQVSDNVVGNLGSLSLDDEPNELSQVRRQVLLVIEQLDDLGVVLRLHELDLTAILGHASLEYVEKDLLEFARLDLVMLQEVEACLDETLHEVLFDALLGPQVVYVLLKNIFVELV